jgi:hypothetical protein
MPSGLLLDCPSLGHSKQGEWQWLRRARNFRFYLCPGSYLPRKYVCGVVPSIVRNISMKALTLS